MSGELTMGAGRGFGWLRQAAAVMIAAGLACPAHAYIDPGTGSMLLQVLGAGIAAGIFYFRELRIKVMSLFSRRQAPAPEEAAEPPCDNPPR
ncbi:MAG: hypothetical protein ACRETI_05110 [Steroidobacteraceae bacterium]